VRATGLLSEGKDMALPSLGIGHQLLQPGGA
jgi:hypothetical protein